MIACFPAGGFSCCRSGLVAEGDRCERVPTRRVSAKVRHLVAYQRCKVQNLLIVFCFRRSCRLEHDDFSRHSYCRGGCSRVERCGPAIIPNWHLTVRTIISFRQSMHATWRIIQPCSACDEDGTNCVRPANISSPAVPGFNFVLYVTANASWPDCSEGRKISGGHCQQHPDTERWVQTNRCTILVLNWTNKSMRAELIWNALSLSFQWSGCQKINAAILSTRIAGFLKWYAPAVRDSEMRKILLVENIFSRKGEACVGGER